MGSHKHSEHMKTKDERPKREAILLRLEAAKRRKAEHVAEIEAVLNAELAAAGKENVKLEVW